MTIPAVPFPPCEICGAPGCGVASSVLGPISHAYCAECANSDREVWSTLVGGLMGLSQSHVAEWVRPIITATCAHYGKTEAELWDEVAELSARYDAEMSETK